MSSLTLKFISSRIILNSNDKFKNCVKLFLRNINKTQIMSSQSSVTFNKLHVTQYSTRFRDAVHVTAEQLRPPLDNEILLKTLYVGINATDINVTAGRYFKHDSMPYPLGFEALSKVETVGSKFVGKYNTGQYVVIRCGKIRAYAEYIYGNETDNIRVIPGPDPSYLTLIGGSGLTASIGLNEGGRLAKGETVLVTAAAGGVGHVVVQLAKLKDCHVIGLCSSDEKEKFLKTLKCDRIINYKKEDLNDVLKREYPNGIDVIWETIGSPVLELLFEHIAIRGRLVNVGSTSGYQTVGYTPINIPDFIVKLHYGGKTLVGFFLPQYKDKYDEYVQLLLQYYNNKQLTMKCDFGADTKDGPFLGLEGIYRGVEYLHSGKNIGKVIIKISE